jgi:hypothetical protein
MSATPCYHWLAASGDPRVLKAFLSTVDRDPRSPELRFDAYVVGDRPPRGEQLTFSGQPAAGKVTLAFQTASWLGDRWLAAASRTHPALRLEFISGGTVRLEAWRWVYRAGELLLVEKHYGDGSLAFLSEHGVI